MGFTKPPNQLYDKMLFINNCEGHPWSLPDNIPCQESALEGIPIGLMLRQSQYKETVSDKLLFFLKDEEHTYCIRCGLETNFSRGLLLGLQVCLAQQADSPIIVAPKISERDEKVIFCNLFANKQRVKVEWDKNISLYALARSLAEKYFPAMPFEKGFEKGEEPVEIKEESIPVDRLTGFLKQAVIKSAEDIPIAHPTGEVDFKTLIAQNSADIKFLGITDQQARNMLVVRYNKRSRHLLSDEELLDFIAYIDGRVKSVKAKREKEDCPF